MTLGLSLGLSLGSRGAGSSGPSYATGDIMSVTIRDGTQLDVDAGSPPYGIDGNGWIAEVLIKGLSTGGTVDATKLTITTSDPGYDTSGNGTTISRTIKGHANLRRQIPNTTTPLNSISGSDVIIRIAISDYIFQGTTITGVTVASGFYTGANASNANTAKVNSSTRTYTKPHLGWINFPNEYVPASTYDVEAVAFHRYAKGGQQVACVKYTATDGTNFSSTVTASSPALSALVTTSFKPEVWKGTLDLTALNNADCTVDAQVFPWLGDSSAILTLSTDRVASGTSKNQQKLPFRNDRSGTYGGAIACVKAGAGSGTVQTTIAAARSTPYATLNAALAALQTYNNANKGHNDHSGSFIYFMDNAGAAQSHSLSANANGTAWGNCWTTLAPDPANTAAVTWTAVANRELPSMLKWTGAILTPAAYPGFVVWYNSTANGSRTIAFDGIAFQACDKSGFNDLYFRNCTQTGSTNLMFVEGQAAAAFKQDIHLVAGCTNGVGGITGHSIIGCDSFSALTEGRTATSNQNINDDNDGTIIYNNFVRNGNTVIGGATISAGYPARGLYVAQNRVESKNQNTTFNLNADGTYGDIYDMVDFHNGVYGNRGSVCYNDLTVSVNGRGARRQCVSKYKVGYDWNTKTDNFGATSGNTGNWAHQYGLGAKGNVFQGSLGGTAPAAFPSPAAGPSTNYLGMYWEPTSSYNIAAATLGACFVNAQAFVSTDASSWGSRAGGGDYHLVSGSGSASIKNRVPSGEAVLSFDLDGVARKNDGTGAAGPYEWTS